MLYYHIYTCSIYDTHVCILPINICVCIYMDSLYTYVYTYIKRERERFIHLQPALAQKFKVLDLSEHSHLLQYYFNNVLPCENPWTASHNQDIHLHYFLDKTEIKG